MKKLTKSLIILGLLLATFGTGFAQNMTNCDVGTINNSATGKIVLKDNAAVLTNNGEIKNEGTLEFEGNTPTFTNNDTFNNTKGTLEFSGALTNPTDVFDGTSTLASDHANRVEGEVLFSSVGTAEAIIPGYFTDVTLSGTGNKNFQNGEQYNVSGTYNVENNTGSRNYGTSTFIYDGLGDQTIFAEGLDNSSGGTYYNLTLTNHAGTATGVKTVSGNVLVANDFTHTAADAGVNDGLVIATGGNLVLGDRNEAVANLNGDLTVKGGGTLNIANGTATLATAKTATIDANGLLTHGVSAGEFGINGTIAANGNVVFVAPNTAPATVANGGALNIGAFGKFYLGSDPASATTSVGSNLVIQDADGFRNDGDGTNMNFNCDISNPALSSTVTYEGDARDVLPTISTNPYCNLELFGSTTKVPEGATYASRQDIYVSGFFTLDNANLNMGPTDESQVLSLLTDGANVTYPDNGGLWEVQGRMQRVMGSAVAYTFNNSATKITPTTNEGQITDMTLNVYPNHQNSVWNNEIDVERTIDFDYNTTGTDWLVEMSYGYLKSELPTHGAFDEKDLRYKEEIAGPDFEKISTGNAIAITEANGTTAWGKAVLAGIAPTNGGGALFETAKVANGATMFLRGGPTTFISVNDGRWSNPATWDEGMEPKPTSFVEIYHTVWAGMKREGFDNWGTNGVASSAPEANPGNLAAGIVIKSANGTNNPSLLLGVTDLPDNFNGWGLVGDIEIESPAGSPAWTAVDVTKEDDLKTGNAKFNNGLIVFDKSGNPIGLNPIGTQEHLLEVKGNVNNCGDLHNGGTITIETAP